MLIFSKYPSILYLVQKYALALLWDGSLINISENGFKLRLALVPVLDTPEPKDRDNWDLLYSEMLFYLMG